jgi:hypothetical protein
MDSEDEIVNVKNNNNIFVALGNNDNCVDIGWNTCSRRNCKWICATQEKQPGCCVSTRRPPTRRPTPRPTPRPTRRPTRRPTPRPNNRARGEDYDYFYSED